MVGWRYDQWHMYCQGESDGVLPPEGIECMNTLNFKYVNNIVIVGLFCKL